MLRAKQILILSYHVKGSQMFILINLNDMNGAFTVSPARHTRTHTGTHTRTPESWAAKTLQRFLNLYCFLLVITTERLTSAGALLSPRHCSVHPHDARTRTTRTTRAILASNARTATHRSCAHAWTLDMLTD